MFKLFKKNNIYIYKRMVRKMREYKKSSDPANLTHIKRTTYLREADMVDNFPLEKFQNTAFYTKYGHDGRFVGFRDIQEYVNELPEDGLNIYNELIPVKGAFIPLYMDIEYLTTEPNIKPFNALLELLYHYCKFNFNDYFKLDGVNMEDWKNYFMISTASRHDKKTNMFKNSYHLKLMGDTYTCLDYDNSEDDSTFDLGGLDYYDDCKLPFPYVYFDSQNDIYVFLDACINNWAANHTDKDIYNLYELIHINNDAQSEQSPLGIVDRQVYKTNKAENSQSFRMLYSQKEWFDNDSELIPLSGRATDINQKKAQIIMHSITADQMRWDNDKNNMKKSIKVDCNHLKGFQENRKDPDTIMNQTAYKLSGVPEEEQAKARLLIQSRLGPSAMIVACDVTYNNDYSYNIQSTDKCLVCQEQHPIEFSSYKNYNYKLYHTPNTNKYKLYCCKENKKGGQYKKLNPIPTGIITQWDYRHEDGEFLCVPFNETPARGNGKSLQKGGTFFYEGPKGSGKTEALTKSLAAIPKGKSVLVLTYRVNLSNTYKADFADYGFTHYKDYHGADVSGKANQNKHRYIVLLDSIKKTVEIDPVNHKQYKLSNGFNFTNHVEKYDYVIIDEIYSCLEHWASKLMGENKLYAMMLFENHIRRCDYLICLDAHLNNAMVMNTINKLRNPDQFICYKNPNAYDMSAYKVNYTEQLYTPNGPVMDMNNLTTIAKFKDKIVEDLLNGKKLCVMSSTKAFVTQLKKEIEFKQEQNQLSKFKILIYTSDTDKTQMQGDMQNIKDVFADKTLKLLLYSPTISAGISYNSDIPEEGFDKLYCCVQTGANVCSLNTTKQMLRRIRQLVDKEIHILFNRMKDPFPLKLEQIEKVLYDQSNDIHKYLGKPELCSGNMLDSCMKIKYDRNRWDYNVWKENAIHRIKYENHSKFTEGLKQSLCNSPGDEIEPGYGMQWIDCTEPLKMTIEEIERCKKQQVVSQILKMTEDYKLYNEYMALPDYTPEEINDLIERSKTGCALQSLNQQEEMIIRRAEVFRVYGIDINKWKGDTDAPTGLLIENWKKLLRFQNVHQFTRQMLLQQALVENKENPMKKIMSEINRRAKKHYAIALQALEQDLALRNGSHYTEKVSSTYDQLIGGDKKQMNTPQILEALYTQKLQQFPKCFEIMEMIGVNASEIKEGTLIKHSVVDKLLKNKKLMKTLQMECHKQFPHLKFRPHGSLYKSEIIIRDALEAWQLEHPNIHILSIKRDEVVSWLQMYGKLPDEYMGAFNKTDHLKVEDFNKVHVKGKLPGKDLGKKINPEILSEGKYWTSAMSESKWETCEVKKFLGLLSKILEDTTGFKCNNLKPKQNENERHRPYVIKNNKLFEELETYKLEVNDPFAYCLMD